MVQAQPPLAVSGPATQDESAGMQDDGKVPPVNSKAEAADASNVPVTPDARFQSGRQSPGGAEAVDAEAEPAETELAEQTEKANKLVEQCQCQLLRAEPTLHTLSLSALNKKAAAHLKAGDAAASAAVYRILFAKATRANITHPELHICHSNCAAACLQLHLYDAALQHAETARRLAEAALRRGPQAAGTFVKSFERKGRALLGLRRHREAAATFDAGLKADPFNLPLKQGLEEANRGVISDLAAGRGWETRAITYPDPSQRITYHPHAAPLHRVRTEDMLPVKLLTPFQAENDVHIKDTYNYMTVQADIRMPHRQIAAVQDSYAMAAWRRAIEGAVAEIEGADKDCRVLNLGAGAGVHAALALRAGARHVTAVERWLYLALVCKETLEANQVPEEQYKVVYKRPADLTIIQDVPVCCNLLIANILDEGLLTSGLIPAVTHALAGLTTSDAIVLPASATVYVQAVELRTTEVCGLDMSAANLYRWHPAYVAGVPLDSSRIKPLSKPVEAWYFDLGAPPDSSATKALDLEFIAEGRFNAVMFWFDIHLFGDVHLSTGPHVAAAALGQRHLQPAVQYLAGELRVDPGTTLPLLASHNTVRMRFDIETADYLHLMKTDAAFPHRHFCMLADEPRLEAYQRAIQRAVAARKAADGEVHVLDMGAGAGALALLAARAGASSVVACEMHESLCDVARKAAAANDLSGRVSVVQRDAALLQRGREVRPLGVNLVVADLFEAGLFGDQFPYILDLTRKKVVQPGATVVPAAATLYCMGIEALTGQVEGVDLSPLDRYRWDAQYEAVQLKDVRHRRLTAPVRVLEHFFDETKRPRGRETLLKLDVTAPGVLNAVVFWFDLHLDDVDILSNAPEGIGPGGVLLDGPGQVQPCHYWGQALQYLDRSLPVEPGRKLTLLARRDGSKMRFALRQGVGEWVDRAPWKIEWGGGASVENPHFQRVHYCELLVRDFLQRCRSGRFPSVEKDAKMVLAHCGSLFLDPASLQQAGHELVVLERLHAHPDFSPAASLEALTRPPLRLC